MDVPDYKLSAFEEHYRWGKDHLSKSLFSHFVDRKIEETHFALIILIIFRVTSNFYPK